MKGGTTITCNECQEQLVPLVYDELVPDERALVLTHLKTCPRCAADHAGLSAIAKAAAQFPVIEPPAGLHDAIVARAIKARDARPKRSVRSAAPEPSWWRRVLERLGTLATSPQIAMASVLLLMVGVGLYALPRLGAPDDSTFETARSSAEVAEAPAASASATALPSPAEEARVAKPLLEAEDAPAAREQARASVTEAKAAAGVRKRDRGEDDLNSLLGSSVATKKREAPPKSGQLAEPAKPQATQGLGSVAASGSGAGRSADGSARFAPAPPATEQLQPASEGAPASAAPGADSQAIVAKARAALARGDLATAAKLASSVTPKSAPPALFTEAQSILAEVALTELRCSDAQSRFRAAGSLDGAASQRVADCRATVANRSAAKRAVPGSAPAAASDTAN